MTLVSLRHTLLPTALHVTSFISSRRTVKLRHASDTLASSRLQERCFHNILMKGTCALSVSASVPRSVG